MKSFIVFIIGLLICIIISITAWKVERKINYNFSYKSLMQQTIKEMIKSECIK